MNGIAKWAGLAGLGFAIALLVNVSIATIPERDHDGRTAAVVVGLLAICALGIVGVAEDLANRGQ